LKEDFYIGKWLIQPQLNQVVSGGKSVRIKPRSMLVLVNLAKADGEVVNKYDLMDAVWGQSVVTEDVLTQSIVELRKAFGDSASDPRMIETIRRVGFRLLQPVTEGSSAKRSLFAELKRRNVVKVAIAYFIVGWLVIEIASVFLPTFEAPDWIMKVFSFLVVLGFPLAMIFSWAFELTPEGIRRDRRPEADIPNGWWSSKAMLMATLVGITAIAGVGAYWRQAHISQVPADSSVAVLPFVNLSDEAGTDFFSDGLSEEVLNTLTLIPGMRVPARTSSFAFRDRDEDVRVIGRSLNVATVLEGSVRRSGNQIRVSAQLIDVETGYHIWSQTYDRELEDVFAVQSDIARSLADALQVTLGAEQGQELRQAGTSNAGAYELYLLGRHHFENELGDWIINARAAFEQAIAADPEFARAYAGLADTYLVYRETPGSFMQDDSVPFDEAMKFARQAVDRALELDAMLADPYVSRAAISASRKDWQAEESDLRMAIELNPSLVPAYLKLGANLHLQGMPDQALEAYKKAETLDPLNPRLAASLARLTAELGDYETAISYPLRLLDNGLRSPLPMEALIEINRVYGRFTDRVRWARELIRLVPTRASAQAELADAYLELGEFDLAESWAQNAFEISPLEALKVRARLYGVRNDAVGFIRLLETEAQIRLPPPPEPLSPAQSMLAALTGIGYYLSDDFTQSAQWFERVTEQSWSIHRRSPEVPAMTQNWLALAYLSGGKKELAEAALGTANEQIALADQQGFGRYPPLLWEKAITYGLSGLRDESLAAWQEAIDMGWRHYFIQGKELNPLPDRYAQDPRYQQISRFLEEDIARMRQEVRDQGWAETPEEYLAREQFKVTAAN